MFKNVILLFFMRSTRNIVIIVYQFKFHDRNVLYKMLNSQIIFQYFFAVQNNVHTA